MGLKSLKRHERDKRTSEEDHPYFVSPDDEMESCTGGILNKNSESLTFNLRSHLRLVAPFPFRIGEARASIRTRLSAIFVASPGKTA